MKLSAISIVTLFGVLATLYSNQVSGQTSQSLSAQALTKKIASMDSILFHAFNTCDVNTSRSLFTDDLEFYHDAGGLTNYAQNVNSILKDAITRQRRLEEN